MLHPEDLLHPTFSYSELAPSTDQDKRISRDDLSPDQVVSFCQLLRKLDPQRFSSEEDQDLLDGIDERSGYWAGLSGKRPKVTSLGGYAGTGKSTLIPLISEALGDTSNTAFVSFTGKAANVLQRKLVAANICNPGYIGTIHRLIYRPLTDPLGRITGWQRRGRPLLTDPNDLDWTSFQFMDDGEKAAFMRDREDRSTRITRIVIDEASMVGERILEDLLEYDIPILAVGDHGQLSPVKDRSVIEKPDIRLEKIHRQAAGNPIIQLATIIRETGGIPKDFPSSPEIQFVSKGKAYEVIGETYERLGLNMAVLVRSNRVRKTINTEPRNFRHPIEGDIVICLKNSPPIYNGMRGILQTVEAKGDHWYEGEVFFPDDGLTVKGLFNRYQFGRDYTIESSQDLHSQNIAYPSGYPLGLLFDFGMALTVHKSQGSAFDEVVLFPEPWSSDAKEPQEYTRWLYTAVTRAAKKITIVR